MGKTVKKIIRASLLALALINLCLSAAGMSPIELDSQAVTDFINNGAVIALAAWNTWKNFSVTKPHLQADEVAEAIKKGAEIIIQYRQGSERLLDADEIEQEKGDPDDPEDPEDEEDW